jgi:hypothetical protein
MDKSNGGSGDDKILAAVTDNQGNVYVTGYTTNNNEDIVTIKYSPSGSALWTSSYNGPGNSDDKAFALLLTTPERAFMWQDIQQHRVTIMILQ